MATCETCALAKWKMTKSGQVNRKAYGECEWKAPTFPIPISVQNYAHPKATQGLWFGEMPDCECHQPKDNPNE